MVVLYYGLGGCPDTHSLCMFMTVAKMGFDRNLAVQEKYFV